MIYLLPGMGADRRLYPPPWIALPDAVPIDWPVYRGETSLREIAQRVVDENSLQPNSWIVGSSLGGMVACEIARLTPVRGLVLIGSARSPDEIDPLLKTLSPLIERAPITFAQQLAGNLPNEICAMFAASDPAFIRAMCRAILSWEGADAATSILRLHGQNDLVIHCPDVADLTLAGGHLIAMTHAEECVEFLRGKLS